MVPRQAARLDIGDEAGNVFRTYAAVQHPLRQGQDVGREPVSSEMRRLPCARTDDFAQSHISGAPEARAAEVALAVGADKVLWRVDALHA